MNGRTTGLTKDDVKIEIRGDELVIEGERREEKVETKAGYFHSERRYGSFYRTGPFPKGTTEKELTNGVLKVTLPTTKPPGPKQIPIGG